MRPNPAAIAGFLLENHMGYRDKSNHFANAMLRQDSNSSLTETYAKEKELSYRAALSVSKKSIKLDVIANQPAMNYGMIATGNHSHF